MKFLADENFPAPSAALLSAAGHDVVHVSDVAQGASDEQVIERANAEGRTILTFDSDMGTLAIAGNKPTKGGVVYFRLHSFGPESPGRMLLDYLAADPEMDLSHRITVFDPPRVRQRRFE